VKRFSQTLCAGILLLMFALPTKAQQRIRISKPGDFIYSGVGIGFFLWGTYSYNHKADWPPKSFSLPDYHSVNRFDRSAVFHYSESAAHTSDILMGGSLILPSFLVFDQSARRDVDGIAICYLQTFFLTLGEIQLVKGLVHRPRPFVYNENVPVSRKMKPDAAASFFSGHTAMTATAAIYSATVYSTYHRGSKEEPWIWAGAVALPALTGYLRYRGGRHFPSDILAGFLIGSANGFLMARLHRSAN
jgi:membrane-associated phospholipid phosphatase